MSKQYTVRIETVMELVVVAADEAAAIKRARREFPDTGNWITEIFSEYEVVPEEDQEEK